MSLNRRYGIIGNPLALRRLCESAKTWSQNRQHASGKPHIIPYHYALYQRINVIPQIENPIMFSYILEYADDSFLALYVRNHIDTLPNGCQYPIVL